MQLWITKNHTRSLSSVFFLGRKTDCLYVAFWQQASVSGNPLRFYDEEGDDHAFNPGGFYVDDEDSDEDSDESSDDDDSAEEEENGEIDVEITKDDDGAGGDDNGDCDGDDG